MNRREAALMVSAFAPAMVPLAAWAQPTGKVSRIGYLGPSADTAPHLLKAFQEGLHALGYEEGRNVVIEYRWTNAGSGMTDDSALLANARDLVARKVDVLAVSIDPAALAARRVAGNVPIVTINVSDPVALGLVATLAHPGGNVTGLSRLSPQLIGKNLEILLEATPGAKRIALLVSAVRGMNPSTIENARQAASTRGLALQVVESGTLTELEAVFAAFRRDHQVEALVVAPGGLFFTQRARLAELALAQRLPAIFANTENVEAGGLMSYSPSSVDNYRRAATFIDKILRGARPGDIPVEQPTRFELVINMRTAKAMNLVIAQSLLVRADRLLE
ncbi:ABC transporter substrate-binding protein [Variovorax rhizosphaerae]|uniref:ABC transporter substrate-binding protein n=1 Tax=Variovorax rhizosphaerae TaxID=1836200 RepID=A0ABU8WCG1_9BURK